MPEPHAGPGFGVINGDLYVDGGVPTGYGSEVNVYDPVSNTWTTKAPMIQSRRAFAAAVIAGRLYVAGGNGSLQILDAYNPH